MRTKFIALAALVLLVAFACGEQQDPEPEVSVKESEAPDYALFDKHVAAIRAFYQAHSDENMEALTSMISDTLQWSPPAYNNNQYLGKEDLLAALKNYHDNFENITWNEGIVMPDSTINGYWSGSVFPKGMATSTPTNIRVYGTWTATHSESGKEIGVKFFTLAGFNEDGKLVSASDYFDVNGIAAQIAEE